MLGLKFILIVSKVASHVKQVNSSVHAVDFHLINVGFVVRSHDYLKMVVLLGVVGDNIGNCKEIS